MKDDERAMTPLTEALEDHSAEGIAILAAEPWRFSQALILTMVGLVVCALVWSFVGRADVIVVAPGVLAPESDVRRIYAPIDGELIDIYMEAGQPVSKGDVLARLNARGAVEAATNALETQLRLQDAERDWKEFPVRKALLERRVAALKEQLEVAMRLYEKRASEGMAQLAEGQRAQLQQARTALDSARREREVAREEFARYQRLFALPGGGGVSQLQVETKRNEYLAAESAFRVAEARLGELTAALSQESSRAGAELERANQELVQLRLQYDAATREAATEEDRVRLKLQSARLAANAAARIQFENIDQDNFLLIVAPVDGVITDVSSTQPGDKVAANAPLAGIAPKGARSVVKMELAERDRGFVREGLAVKLKFSAFPYQRYGVIDGTVEFISPTTKASGEARQPVFDARVSLARDHYTVGGQDYPLRYGMTATAEIAVRERRVIDLALDPFRQVGG